MLARLSDLVEQRCQFVIATHSPIVLALPGATICEISDDGTIEDIEYDTASPGRTTREFSADPGRYLGFLA
ncbi:hypothetical protein [Rhodococcoides yunnanense]|uniref:hypothetical protein n=1 Tax=Rhodococcoides yunnanense TaxID=278209 RepID=UPI00093510F6|nr:hypothetical protein [Rhodococcus yunnanensis]